LNSIFKNKKAKVAVGEK